jgi:hypothetical protein
MIIYVCIYACMHTCMYMYIGNIQHAQFLSHNFQHEQTKMSKVVHLKQQYQLPDDFKNAQNCWCWPLILRLTTITAYNGKPEAPWKT